MHPSFTLPGKKRDTFDAVEGIEIYTDDGLAWESEQQSRQNLLSSFGGAGAQAPAANEPQLSKSLIKVAPRLTTRSVRPWSRES